MMANLTPPVPNTVEKKRRERRLIKTNVNIGSSYTQMRLLLVVSTKLTMSPCREVSDVRVPDDLARADFGDNLEELSRLEMESSVALGDPCGVAAVVVIMGAGGGCRCVCGTGGGWHSKMVSTSPRKLQSRR